MRPLRALLAALLAAAATGSAAVASQGANASAPCEATVSLDPPRALPGQQVAYRLHLLVRSDVAVVAWELPPAFPGLRAERVAVASLAQPVERGGAIYQQREEARALFAELPGRIALPHARLGCGVRGGGDAPVGLETPEASLEVVPFPAAGRPPGFAGLVGPLALRRSVTPQSVSVGRSVRISVTLQGDGNLWDAPAPELSSEELGGAEVFHRPAELVLERGARLVVRRRFAIDVVPRREGVLRIPAFAWAYFDPTTGAYAEAVAEAVDIRVGPPAAIGDLGERPADRIPARAPADGPTDASRRSPTVAFPTAGLVAAALLLAGGIGSGAWHRLRRRRRVARAIADAFASAASARAVGDRDTELAALARALRASLEPELGTAAAGSPDEILAAASSPRAAAAARLLAGVERARFDPTAPAPERGAVAHALGAPQLCENPRAEEEGR